MSPPDEPGATGRGPAMQIELTELVDVARAGELTPAEFGERVELIHARHLGGDIDASEFVNGRQRALAAYEEYLTGRDRHHELEKIAEALGVARERPTPDLNA